ncbi:XdhC family protein [Nocardioides massiliensis]|uniref:Xanthine dehydrogenase accessory factor n=1 Tax=Nocardioides massiliensis TaxID=1325935 RepID=A0ABT9NUY1_9ACTN|nr:XdhC/CoxI family protein [Nocardioides massiliensis]MDP9824239.1 xanthine dehydrogenase accessory factor [Nocardioides massiliensis]
MFDVVGEAVAHLRAGHPVALATVVGADGSSPRDPGASMLVLADGTVVGSVSGGCVEGAVYDIAQQVLADGTPVREEFGYSDADAFAVGLTCGGVLNVFIQRLDPDVADLVAAVADDVAAGRPVSWVSVVAHPEADWLGRRLVVRPDTHDGSLGERFADHAVVSDVRGVLAAGDSRLMHFGARGERMGEEMEVFVASFQPPARMLIFGAVDFAAALAQQASFLGFRVTVCDARPVFATPERFPGADEVVVDWPHRYVAAEADAGRVDRRTVVCVLTHDAKFDVPVLKAVTDLPADVRPAYIGVMGSRTTHADRLRRLREAGVTEEQIALLSSPIGLDLGGRTPQETAVAIAAEIIAQRWGGTGAPLADLDGPIRARR